MKSALIWNNWNGRFSSSGLFTKHKLENLWIIKMRSPLDNIDHLLNIANKKNSNLKFIYGDLNDYSSLVDCIELSKPNYVFHLAAQSYPKTSFTEGNLTLETNIIGTYNLLNAINKSKYNPYIHVCSSSEIFGKVPKEKLPIDEKCNFHQLLCNIKSRTDLIGRYFMRL